MSEQNLNTNHNRNYLHLLKTLDYRIFIASFCGIIIFFLHVFLEFPRYSQYRSHPRIPLIEVHNYDYEPLESGTVTIRLNNQSQISINNHILDDPAKLKIFTEDDLIMRKSEKKVLLIVEEMVPFEKVNQILQSLSKIRIKKVGLLVESPSNPLVKYMREKIFNRGQIKKH